MEQLVSEACLCGNNVFKGEKKTLNLDICIFSIFSFHLGFISSLVITSSFFILESKCTSKKYRVLPYLTSVICVNLSFAMVIENTTSLHYQLCVKTMYQARDKEIVEVLWCSTF